MHEEDVKKDVKEDVKKDVKKDVNPTNSLISTNKSPKHKQSPKKTVKFNMTLCPEYSNEIDKDWFKRLIKGRASTKYNVMENSDEQNKFKRIFGFKNDDTQSEIQDITQLKNYIDKLIHSNYIWGKNSERGTNLPNQSEDFFNQEINSLLVTDSKNDWNDDTKKYISQLAQAIHEALEEAKIFEIISQESIQDTQINETYQDFFKDDELLSNALSKTESYNTENYQSLKKELTKKMNIALSISEKLMPCIKDWVNEGFRLEFDKELGKHNIEGQFIENKPDLRGMIKYWVNLSNNKIGENFIPTIVHEFAHKMEYNLDVKNLILLYRHLLARMKTKNINKFIYTNGKNKMDLFLFDLYIPNYKEVAKEMKIDDAHLLYCCNAKNATDINSNDDAKNTTDTLPSQSTEFLSTTAEFMSQKEKAEILINNDPMRVALFFYFSNKDIFNKISNQFNSTLTSSQDNASKISLEELLHINVSEKPPLVDNDNLENLQLEKPPLVDNDNLENLQLEKPPLVDNDNLENLQNENWFLSFIKSLLCCCTNTD